MDTRAARRTAEKAARDLIAQRASLIGDLAVLHTERARLTDDVSKVQARGQQLLAAAESEAQELVAAAQERAREAEQRYAHAYDAATGAGWPADDLAALGYRPGRADKPRRRPRRLVEQANDADVATAALAS